jgi:hypothetical protein
MESSTHIHEFSGGRIKAGRERLSVVKTHHYFQHEKTAEINTSH